MTEDGQFLAFQQLLCRLNNKTSGTATTPHLCPTSPQSSVRCSMTYYYNLHGIYAGGLYVGTRFRTIDSFSGDQGHGRNWTKSTIQADFPPGTPIEFVFNFTCNPNPIMEPLVFSQVTQGIVAIDDITVVCDCSAQQASCKGTTPTPQIFTSRGVSSSQFVSTSPTDLSGTLPYSTTYQSSSQGMAHSALHESTTTKATRSTVSPVESNEQQTAVPIAIILGVSGLAAGVIITLAVVLVMKKMRSRLQAESQHQDNTAHAVSFQLHGAPAPSTENPAYGVAITSTCVSTPSKKAAGATRNGNTSTNNPFDSHDYMDIP
ncbi:uncharacterized protein LOC135808544 [Sycon ciliatum]|uniref:uncharacterized protein LOC135808544 n=1 Tax=Sycon ciliatum TaxID=27933 RepID=UPI0031F6FCD4